MDLAKSVAKLIGEKLRYPNGKPVECVIADTCIGGVAEAAACAEKFAREGVGAFAHRHAVLVLRQRDDGHGPDDCRKRSGVSTAPNGRARFIWRRCWPAMRKRACPRSAFTGAMCRMAATKPFPPTCRKKFCASAAPVWPSPSCAANLIWRWAAFRWASPVRSWTSRFLRDYLGMRVETVDMTEFVRRMERGIYRQGRIRKGARVGENELPGRQGLQFAQDDAPARATGQRMGNIRQDGAHRARLDGGQSASWRRKVSARKRRATTPSRPVSRASANGRTTCPTAISWKRFSTRRSIGTACARLTSSRRKTIRSTARACCSAICSRTPRRFLPTCGLIGAGGGQARDRPQTDRRGGGRISASHQFRPRDAGRNGRAIRRRQARDETVLGNHEGGSEEMSRRPRRGIRPSRNIFRGGGWSTRFLTRGGMPVTMCRLNLVKGLGPALQIAEGETVELPEKVHNDAGRAHQSHLADDVVRAAHVRQRRVPRRLYRDEQLGRESWRRSATATSART